MGTQSVKLRQVRPVTFHYTADQRGAKQYGLIAEEVATMYPDLANRGEDGQVASVQYHQLIPMLLSELQQQQRRNDQRRKELVELRTQHANLQAAMMQVEVLAARLERLEAGQATTLARS